MKKITLLLTVLIGIAGYAETRNEIIKFCDTSSVYSDLLDSFNAQVSLFDENLTEKSFNSAKDTADKLIEMSPQDPRAYLVLHSLYIKAGRNLISNLEAYEKALQVLERYEQVEGEKYDISAFRKRDKEQIKNLKEYEHVQKYTAQMEEDKIQPPAVVQANELLLKSSTETNLVYCDEALNVLNAARIKDPTNYKLYVALMRTYRFKMELVNAYAAWQLAVHFGAEDSNIFQGEAVSLYLKTVGYEKSYSISKENPGIDFDSYFLWLNREKIWEKLTPRNRDHIKQIIQRMDMAREKKEEGSARK